MISLYFVPISNCCKQPYVRSLPRAVDFLGYRIWPDYRLLRKANVRRTKRKIKKLHKSGLSWKRLEELGLEYRLVAQYLQHKLTHQEMAEQLEKVMGIGVVIIDANDYGVNILGTSDLATKANWPIKQIFADNPMGQAREQTPIVIVRKDKVKPPIF